MSGAMRKMGVYLGLVEDDPYGEYGDPASERSAERGYAEPAAAPDRAGRYSERGYAEPAAYDGTFEPGYDARGEYSADRAPARAAARREVDHRVDVRAMDARAIDPRMDSGADYRITTLHPRTYNEARTIGEHFRAGTPVIMNLTDMDDADAKRLVDFSAGLTFGLHGRIERVTAKVFLLSPDNVSVTAEDKARIVESGFFNQS
jgi:cell division inhibitor SepF